MSARATLGLLAGHATSHQDQDQDAEEMQAWVRCFIQEDSKMMTCIDGPRLVIAHLQSPLNQ
ncbi:MAG: hypothetical protein ACI96P_000758 [Candidatus Azotimanducaceae bacterium]|jgi:hypothetical protein